ncbi:phytanoyl-CoA dioxygenase family protein [Aspergillus foveolatus]|uniref:phytanoyl-CoA dioxygenase family protein n=1 Tax=Aspergillus foveolatus TaxID=210207 RepID=UPI003CCD614F
MALSSNEDGLKVQYVIKDTPLEDIIAFMKRDGAIIVRDLVSPADIDQAYEELRPCLEQRPRWDGSFFPKETQRTPNLIAISPTYTRTQMMNPLFHQLCDHFLTTRSWNWWGDEWTETVSRPYISATSALSVGPGAKAQPLHRDDYVSHNYIVESSTFDYRQQVSITMIVAGCKVTKENGGTQFIPGSHLWGSDRPNPPKVTDCTYASMEKGDALVLFSSLYHGGGHNTTTNEHRLVFTTCAIRSYFRQEENQYLAVPMQRVREYDRDTQKFIGYSMSEPACGHANEMDPIYLVNPEELETAKPIQF